MPLIVIDKPVNSELLSGIVFDNRVVETFISLEHDDRNPQRDVVTLLDRFYASTGESYNARQLLRPSWIVVFQIGGNAAALHLATMSVQDIEHLRGPLKAMLAKPELTINTRRTIVDLESDETVAAVTSSITVPTKYLNIYASPSDTYHGSWEDPNEPFDPNGDVMTFLDLHDDPRDKKVGD